MAYGFARGIRQNVYFFGGRLDVYTSWENYQNAIDGSNTVSGLLRINEADGLPNGIMIYDVPSDSFLDNVLLVIIHKGSLSL